MLTGGIGYSYGVHEHAAADPDQSVELAGDPIASAGSPLVRTGNRPDGRHAQQDAAA